MPDGVFVKIEDKRVRRRLQKIPSKQLTEAEKSLFLAAQVLRTRALKGIQDGPASGAARADGSRASAEGEFPMTDTGLLAASVFAEIRKGGSGAVAFVGSSINYAKWLEFGTQRMAARPWLQPSWNDTEAQIKRIIRAGWKKANRGR